MVKPENLSRLRRQPKMQNPFDFWNEPTEQELQLQREARKLQRYKRRE